MVDINITTGGKTYPSVTEHSPKEVFEMHEEIDLSERLTGDNLLDPLTFEEGEIDLFIRDNKCGFCGGFLFKMFAPDRLYIVHCPEHGAIFEHTKTTVFVAEEVKRNVRVAKNELRQPEKPRSEAVIMEELGF